MQGGGGSGQSSPAKPERPPLSKKSKTTSSNSDDSPTPHFPAVRCLPSTPPTFSAPSTTSSSASTTTSSEPFSFNFSDRDYVFPSNLGGYSSRRNVSVKSSSSSSFSKSQQQQQSLPQPARSASMPPSLRGGGGGGGGLTSPPNKSKLRAEKDLKALSLQASVSSSLGLIPAPAVASESGHRDTLNSSVVLKNSWKVSLVSCCSSISFSIFNCVPISLSQCTINLFMQCDRLLHSRMFASIKNIFKISINCVIP